MCRSQTFNVSEYLSFLLDKRRRCGVDPAAAASFPSPVSQLKERSGRAPSLILSVKAATPVCVVTHGVSGLSPWQSGSDSERAEPMLHLSRSPPLSAGLQVTQKNHTHLSHHITAKLTFRTKGSDMKCHDKFHLILFPVTSNQTKSRSD